MRNGSQAFNSVSRNLWSTYHFDLQRQHCQVERSFHWRYTCSTVQSSYATMTDQRRCYSSSKCLLLLELYTTITFDSSFTVTTLIHPSTYLNKILIGSNQGTMQLWNIRTSTMVYAFKGFNSPTTCFTQTPVVDVIAIGLLDGSVVIHNIRTDVTLMTLRQEGKVTSITFRTGRRTHSEGYCFLLTSCYKY